MIKETTPEDFSQALMALLTLSGLSQMMVGLNLVNCFCLWLWIWELRRSGGLSS